MECEEVNPGSAQRQLPTCGICSVPLTERWQSHMIRCEDHKGVRVAIVKECAEPVQSSKESIEELPKRIRLRLTKCLRCWNPMTPGPVGGAPKKFCSPKCLQESHSRRRANKRGRSYQPQKKKAPLPYLFGQDAIDSGFKLYECRCCLRSFANPKNWKSNYCSNECRYLVRCVQAVCVICEEPYFHLPNSGRTCSPKCSAELQRRERPALQLRCEWCKKDFSAQVTGKRKYCDFKCRETVRRKKRRLYLNNWQRVREQREKATTVERISPLDVFKRDDWTCWLCHQPVDMSQQHPEPNAPTVDHVIPISKGGPHTMDNVRCAHSICNMKKNNSTIGTESMQGEGY
jgi:hypothetical protein